MPIETRCPECGGTRKVLDGALMLVCEYCGAFMGVSDSVDARMAMGKRAMEMFTKPNEAAARFQKLAADMPAAVAARDREGWRAMAREMYSLTAVLFPDNVPGKGRQAIAEWVREAVAVGDLNNFDPAVKPAFDGYTAGLTAMLTGPGDKVAAARAAMAAAERYFRAVIDHPDCPPSMATKGPARLAADMLRSSLGGLTSVLGQETIERIRAEVLEEKKGPSGDLCPECGADLSGEKGALCPYCGTALKSKDSDPWVDEQVALFEQTRAAAPQLAGDSLIYTALGFVMNGVRVDPKFPPDRAARFLRKVLPGVAPAQLMDKANVMFPPSGAGAFLAPLASALAAPARKTP